MVSFFFGEVSSWISPSPSVFLQFLNWFVEVLFPVIKLLQFVTCSSFFIVLMSIKYFYYTLGNLTLCSCVLEESYHHLKVIRYSLYFCRTVLAFYVCVYISSGICFIYCMRKWSNSARSDSLWTRGHQAPSSCKTPIVLRYGFNFLYLPWTAATWAPPSMGFSNQVLEWGAIALSCLFTIGIINYADHH